MWESITPLRPGETSDFYYEIHTFTESGRLTFKDLVKPSIAADVLVVGGGGGSGGDYKAPSNPTYDYAGGGGAGGLLYKTGHTLTLQDGSATVVVGAGGIGGAPQQRGQNGGDSWIGSSEAGKLPAPGGGGGGGALDNSDGGSGGGGGATYGGSAGSAGIASGNAVDGLGHNGGKGGGDSGGGGGGAGGPGGSGGAHNAPGAGAPGWKPADKGAAWIEQVADVSEFAQGGRGGGSNVAKADGANYGDGGSAPGGTTRNQTGSKGHDGIVIVRFAAPTPKKLYVFFNLGKFEPLMRADVKTGLDDEEPPSLALKLTLAAAPAVRLWPRYIADYFAPVAFSQNTAYPFIAAPDSPHSYAIKELSDTLKDIAAFYSPLAFTSDPLPQRDVDALLEFALKYQAFGVSDHGGKVWTIKNGLYNAPDDGGGSAGSYIPVKFGAGTPPEKKGGGTIIYTK